MFISSPNISPDSLLTAEDTAAVVLAMNGKFDDRIKELKAAKAALDASNAVAKTIAAAQKLEAAAVAKLDTAQKFEQDVKARETASVARETAASEAITALTARESAVILREAAITTTMKKQEDANTITVNRLEHERVVLNKEKADFAEEKMAFEVAKADFNKKLAALKV